MPWTTLRERVRKTRKFNVDVWLIEIRSLFLSFALLFWSFQIKENAKCPIDEWSFTDGGNAHPKPFKVIFEPRISSSLEEVKALYEDYEL